MSDLVGNPEDRFSRVAAQIINDKAHTSCRFKAGSFGSSENVQMEVVCAILCNFWY